MSIREEVERAFFGEDLQQLARVLRSNPPLGGYDQGFSIAHLAVLTGKPAILKMTIGSVGTGWDLLSQRRNHKGQTPRDLAIEFEYPELVSILDDQTVDSSRGKQPHKPVVKSVNATRAAMSIEDELQEERFDAAGRKNRAKLGANANGKPYWRG